MIGFLYFIFFFTFPWAYGINHCWGHDTGVPSETGFLIRILSSFLVLLNIFCPKQKRKHDLALDVLPGSGETKTAECLQ